MIVVVGDSWGVGEWDANCNIGGPGFAQYLMKDHAVINLSIPGGSNGMSIDRLQELLSKYSPEDDDLFYWIVTCPGRCTTQEYFFNSTDLHRSIQKLLDDCLERANRLAQQHGININLIGGLCDLDQVDSTKYQNLNISVDSWCKLLDQSYQTFCFDGAGYWDKVGTHLKQAQSELIEQWITIADRLHQRRVAYGKMKKTYMKTDGCHPDRDGHRVLLETLSINKE